MKHNAIFSMEIYLDEKICFHTKCIYNIKNEADIICFDLIDNSLDKINIFIIAKNNTVYILQDNLRQMIFLDVNHLIKTDEFDIIKNDNNLHKFINIPIKNFDFVLYNGFCDVKRDEDILNIKLKGSTKKHGNLYDVIIAVKRFEKKEVNT